MLYRYQLTNFKAFAETEAIPLRPITLIYGPNSAGKSSIMQSILLLQQTLQEVEDAETLLLPNGRLVNLGNYREFVHLHETERVISFSNFFKVSVRDIISSDDFASSLFEDREFVSLGLKLSFKYSEQHLAVEFDCLKFFIDSDSSPLITCRPDQKGLLVIDKISSEHELWKKLCVELKPSLSESLMSKIRQSMHFEEPSRRDLEKQLREQIERRVETLESQLKEADKKFSELKESEEQLDSAINELKEKVALLNAPKKRKLNDLKLESERLSNELNELSRQREKDEGEREKGEPIDEAKLGRVSIEIERLDSRKKQLKEEIEQLEREISSENEQSEEVLTLSNYGIERADIKSKMEGIKSSRGVTENELDRLKLWEGFWLKIDRSKTDDIAKDLTNAVSTNTILCRNFLPVSIRSLDASIDDENRYSFKSAYQELAEEAYQLLSESIFELIIRICSLFQEYLDEIVYIGPLRDYPERFYIFSGTPTKQVGKSGKMMPDILFKNPHLMKEINEVLEKFNLGYELNVVPFSASGSEASDLYALQLIDKHSRANISLLDVGFGVSQILPIIVQVLFSQSKVLLIEQPEIHIHPRLQTELGSLLAEKIKAPANNQFIIETHSEHLMLRLQKLIREKKLTPKDVSVIYVDRDSSGSTCFELRLDNEGDFIDEWPHGFFEEGFEEIFS